MKIKGFVFLGGATKNKMCFTTDLVTIYKTMHIDAEDTMFIDDYKVKYSSKFKDEVFDKCLLNDRISGLAILNVKLLKPNDKRSTTHIHLDSSLSEQYRDACYHPGLIYDIHPGTNKNPYKFAIDSEDFKSDKNSEEKFIKYYYSKNPIKVELSISLDDENKEISVWK
jgi:hypothetical protein